MSQFFYTYIFMPVSQILFFFYGLVGSVGFSLFIVGMIYGLLRQPLNLWFQYNNRKYQALLPQITRIQNKYRYDTAKKNAEVNRFLTENKNPAFGSCLSVVTRAVMDILIALSIYRFTAFLPFVNRSFLIWDNITIPRWGVWVPSWHYLVMPALILVVRGLHIRFSSQKSGGAELPFWQGYKSLPVFFLVLLILPTGFSIFWFSMLLLGFVLDILWDKIRESGLVLLGILSGGISGYAMFWLSQSTAAGIIFGVYIFLLVYPSVIGFFKSQFRWQLFSYRIFPDLVITPLIFFYAIFHMDGILWPGIIALLMQFLLHLTFNGMGKTIFPFIRVKALLAVSEVTGNSKRAVVLINEYAVCLREEIRLAGELSKTNPSLALKRLENVLQQLRKYDNNTPKFKNNQAQAHLHMGMIYQKLNNAVSAEKHLDTAYNLGLPEACLTLAPLVAKSGKKNSYAVDVYVQYLTLRKMTNLQTEDDILVTNALKSACQVKTGDTSSRLKEASQFNEKVLKNLDFAWAHFNLGLIYYIQKNWKKAISYLNTANQKQKSDPVICRYLGLAYLETRQNQQALDLLEESVILDSRQVDVAFKLGELAAEMAFNEKNKNTREQLLLKSMHWFEHAINMQEANASQWFQLGKVYFLCEEYSKARFAFKRSTAISTENREIFFWQAKTYYKLGELSEAVTALEQVLKTDSKNYEAHRMMAEILYEQQQYERAIKHFEAALTGLKIENNDGLIQSLGICYYKTSNYTGAVEKLSAVIEYFPGAAFYLGRSLFELGENKKALKHLSAYLNLEETNVVGDPHISEASLYLCRANAREGKFKQAISLLEKHVQRFGATAETFYHLGCFYANQDSAKYPEALQAFERSTRQAPDFWRSNLMMGHIYLSTGQIDEAISAYTRAEDYQPYHSEVLLAFAHAAYLNGDLKTAESKLSLILKNEPDHSQALDILGKILERQDKYSEASQAFRKSGHPLNLGRVLCKTGCYEEARDVLFAEYDRGNDSDELLNYLGFSLSQIDEYDAALNIWQKLLDRYPEDKFLALNITYLNYLSGFQHYHNRDYPVAVLQWEQYLRQYPEDQSFRKHLATLYGKIGLSEIFRERQLDTEKARTWMKRAVELDGEDPDYRFGLALVDLKDGNWQQGEERLRELLELDTDNQEYRYHLALTLLNQGRLKELDELLLSIQPEDGDKDMTDKLSWLRIGFHLVAGVPQKAGEMVEAYMNLDANGSLEREDE